MADFSVEESDVTNAVTFLEQFLSTNLPQYDFSEGTSNRDIAINSLAYITAFFRKEISDIRNRQSLLTLSTASEDLDEESADELVNEILSDWFLTRKTGRKSTGFVSLKFSTQQIGVITFRFADSFVRLGKRFTITGSDLVVQASDLVTNVDNLGIEFFTTSIQLVAESTGEGYDIDAGRFEQFPQVSPHLVAVENLEKFTGGDGKETSSEMITRSATAIAVRDLNIIPAIDTVLTEEFSQVLEVSPIGYGDPELQRDLIDIPQGTGTISIHRGSMYDAYIKFPVEFGLFYASVVPSSGGIEAQSYTVNSLPITAMKLPDFPIYRIKRVINRNVSPEVDVSFTVITSDFNFWNSNRQDIYLQINNSFTGLFLDLEYDSVTGYEAVQSYMEIRRNRIIVADPLAKAAYAMYLSFEIRYYASAIGIPDIDVAKTTMQSFITSQAIGSEFHVSDVTCHFLDNYPGNSPQLPFVIVGELLLPNGKILSMTFEDRVRSPDRYYFDELEPDILFPLFTGDDEPGDKVVVVLTNIQVSTRTINYVADLSDIGITEVSI